MGGKIRKMKFALLTKKNGTTLWRKYFIHSIKNGNGKKLEKMDICLRTSI